MKETYQGFEVVKHTTWHPAKLGEVLFHEACVKPDKQSEQDYQRLKEDIGENGIRNPVVVQRSSNAVISGRHRVMIGKELGVPIPVVVVDISDSEAWSLSRSELCHRNLSPTRAAVIFLEMKELQKKAEAAEAKANSKSDKEEADAGEGEKEGKTKKDKPKKREKAKAGSGKKAEKEAKEAGTSRAVMERAKRVREKGIPALWKAMEAGTVTANDASAIVEFDQDVQKAALNLVKDGKAKTLKAAKAQLDKEAKAAEGPVLRDGNRKEVPKKLTSVFEDRGQFSILREQVIDVGKSFAKLVKRESGKHIPKELVKHMEDIALALDLYQPFAVVEESEDGWITKKEAKDKA